MTKKLVLKEVKSLTLEALRWVRMSSQGFITIHSQTLSSLLNDTAGLLESMVNRQLEQFRLGRSKYAAKPVWRVDELVRYWLCIGEEISSNSSTASNSTKDGITSISHMKRLCAFFQIMFHCCMWVLGQYYFAEHPKLEACSGTVVARNQARTSYLQWKPNMIRTETNDLNFPSKSFEPISYPNFNLNIIPYLNASLKKKRTYYQWVRR